MAVREGLLALLHDGPRHGYQLKTDFEAATGGVWPLNVGQVYTTLERLERDGLVGVADSDGQKVYSITVDGVHALGLWWQATPVDDPPPRDELMLKVLMAIERNPGNDHALAVITRQRTVLLSMLQAKRRERAGQDETLATTLVTDALVVRAEADLRWLDLCEAHLQKARTSTSPSRGTTTKRKAHA